jgi:hypothetical protein
VPFADWRFLLCDTPPVGAAEGTPLVPLGEITQARDKSVEVIKNASGSLGFTIPLSDRMAYEMRPVTRCVLATRNGIPIWSGPIATLEGSASENRIAVRCVGWFELLNFRELRVDKDYTGQKPDTNPLRPWTDAEIAFDLLGYANTVEPEFPTWVSPGNTNGVFQPRGKKWSKGQKIAQAIAELSQIEAGFDWDIDPMTRRLNLSAWDAYTDRSDSVHFGFGWGPHNIQSLSWSIDGTKLVNHMHVFGNNGQYQFETDLTSKQTYGVFEESRNLPGANEPLILKAYAVEEVLIHANPLPIYNFLPFAASAENPDLVPTLFDDYWLGDKVRFSANHGALQVSGQAVRIFGATISIDNEGNERITSLQTSPSGA